MSKEDIKYHGVDRRKDEQTPLGKYREIFNDRYIEKSERYIKRIINERGVSEEEARQEYERDYVTQRFLKDDVRIDIRTELMVHEKDKLTNLPQRDPFITRYELSANYFKAKEKEDEVFVVVFFDVDDFKNINDTGQESHIGGDKVLKRIGEILKGKYGDDKKLEKTGVLRTTDVAARMGGDEFMFLLYANQNEVNNALARIHEELQKITYLDENGQEKNIGISMGARVFNKEDEIPFFDEVHRKVDETTYLVKTEGKNDFKVMHINEEVKESEKNMEWYIRLEVQKHIRELDEMRRVCPDKADDVEQAYKTIGERKYECNLIKNQ